MKNDNAFLLQRFSKQIFESVKHKIILFLVYLIRSIAYKFYRETGRKGTLRDETTRAAREPGLGK